jgi:hypothetical protein
LGTKLRYDLEGGLFICSNNLGKRWGHELDGMQALRVNDPIDFKALWLTKDFAKLGWLIACLQNS